MQFHEHLDSPCSVGNNRRNRCERNVPWHVDAKAAKQGTCCQLSSLPRVDKHGLINLRHNSSCPDGTRNERCSSMTLLITNLQTFAGQAKQMEIVFTLFTSKMYLALASIRQPWSWDKVFPSMQNPQRTATHYLFQKVKQNVRHLSFEVPQRASSSVPQLAKWMMACVY